MRLDIEDYRILHYDLIAPSRPLGLALILHHEKDQHELIELAYQEPNGHLKAMLFR